MIDRRLFLSGGTFAGLTSFAFTDSLVAQSAKQFPTTTKIRGSGPEFWKLVDLINDHRKTRRLPAIALSPRLTAVAYLHARDLAEKMPHETYGSMHSWSRDPRWTGGAYQASDPSTHKIMWDKPKEITGYKAHGFEICVAKARSIEHAFEVWTKSALHHSVMVNEGIWAKPRWQWKAIGAVFNKGFACGWFGAEPDEVG